MHGQQRSRNAFILKQHHHLSNPTEESGASPCAASPGLLCSGARAAQKTKDPDCENVFRGREEEEEEEESAPELVHLEVAAVDVILHATGSANNDVHATSQR
jgi:hypothetical protein